jgi:transcriptional regulator of acetoin/glycerol metabolism
MGFRATEWTVKVAAHPDEAKKALVAELHRRNGNVKAVATALGLSRFTVYKYMHALGIPTREGAPE